MTAFVRRNSAARKLNVYEVQQIRKAYEEGETQGSIAKRYTMSAVQIGRIVRGESWASSAGARGPSPRETDEILQRLIEVQESVEAAPQAPPISPLEGGDLPSETHAAGTQALLEKARSFGIIDREKEQGK